MSIQYRFVPIYDNLNEDSEKVTGFYPKVVSRGTINKERMLRCLPERFLHFRYLRQIPSCRPHQRNPSRIHFRKGHACPHFGGRQ